MDRQLSLIIIEKPNKFEDELSILKAIGKENFTFKREVKFEDCLRPKDNSINIGYYNNNIIICDDFSITIDYLRNPANLNLSLTKVEEKLCTLFPKSEIVSVVCHGAINFHAYSIIRMGKKVRLKSISSEEYFAELGPKIKEENQLYALSYRKNGKNYWKSNDNTDSEYTEDQYMEPFVFGITKRRLGIQINNDEAYELLNTKFRKYTKQSFFKKLWGK